MRLHKDDTIADILEFYMGKEYARTSGFYNSNLRIEEEVVDEVNLKSDF